MRSSSHWHACHWLAAALLAAGLLALHGCSDDSVITTPDSAALSATPDKTEYEMVEGTVGGAYYALYRPANWNGDLVIVARGYMSPWDTPEPPGADEFFISTCREGLLDLGFGVAYSSYSDLGWCVKEAMIDLHQLKGIYTSRLGRPDDTYLCGFSMGAQIVVALAEKYSGQYAGVLAESGPLGGARMIFQQIFGVRVLFDYYYPGVMPGTVLHIPPDTDAGSSIDAAIDAMLTDPEGLMELAAIQQLDLRWTTTAELLTTTMWHLYLHITATNELVERIGGSPLDNVELWYSGTSDDEALNAGVARFETPPRAARYLTKYYEPDGDIRIPVLTLHNTLDPLVPLGHEEEYAARVAVAGQAEFLRQETFERQDHAFSGEETVAAFQELVDWVQGLRGETAVTEVLISR